MRTPDEFIKEPAKETVKYPAYLASTVAVVVLILAGLPLLFALRGCGVHREALERSVKEAKEYTKLLNALREANDGPYSNSGVNPGEPSAYEQREQRRSALEKERARGG